MINSPKENHFTAQHCHSRFVVPSKKPDAKPLGKSHSQAVRRFVSILHSQNQVKEFSAVINKHVQMKHAEQVPEADLESPVFYLPMHVVQTTTMIRAVFYASMKSSTGFSLNNNMLLIVFCSQYVCQMLSLPVGHHSMQMMAYLVLTQVKKPSSYNKNCTTFFVVASYCANGMPVNLLSLNISHQIYKMLTQILNSTLTPQIKHYS